MRHVIVICLNDDRFFGVLHRRSKTGPEFLYDVWAARGQRHNEDQKSFQGSRNLYMSPGRDILYDSSQVEGKMENPGAKINPGAAKL